MFEILQFVIGGIVLLVGFWFFLIIVIIAISSEGKKKRLNVRQATSMIFDFIGSVFNAFFEHLRARHYFPVLFGWSNNRCNYEHVDMVFADVRKNFLTAYCQAVSYPINADTISYVFCIARKFDGIEDDDLIRLITKQTEQIVAKSFRLYECNAEPSDVVMVSMTFDELVLEFALNYKGIKVLNRRKAHIRELEHDDNRKNNGNDCEDWSNGIK